MDIYVIVELEDYSVERVLGYYKSLSKAESALNKLMKEYDDEIIGAEDDYFQLQNDYGNIISYQIITLDYKKIKEEIKNEK